MEHARNTGGQSNPMEDLVFVSLIAVLFLATAGLVLLFENLMERPK